MKIKSKLQLILIPLLIFAFVGIGIIPFSTYIKNVAELHIYKTDGSVYLPTQLFAFGVLVLIIYLLYIIVTRTLIIHIDVNLKEITFFYPFILSTKKYSFNEIKSFSFSYWHSKICDFKCLNFQTEEKIFRFSDFEISNFRTIEKFAFDHFNLSLGEKFELIIDDLILKEIVKNKKFDIEQAKSYRFTCYLFLALAVYIIFLETFGPSTFNKIGIFGISICICFVIFTISKILQANRIIKNFS